VRVVVAGSSVGELALHYLNRLGIAVLKVPSKFELRRLCRVVGATPLARMGPPTPEEAGRADVFETVEIGGDRCTVVRQRGPGEPGFDPSAGERTRTATVVLRGATANRLDDLERAVDDGVSVLKSLLKDARLVPGAGATELALSRAVDAYGAGMKGLSQHAVKRYAQALEAVPRTIAENALGAAEGNEVLSRLWAKHEQPGGEAWGVDVEVRRARRRARRLLTVCGAGGDGRHARRGRAQDLGLARGQALGAQARDRGRRRGALRRRDHHEPAGRGAQGPAAVGQLGRGLEPS
jgi:chaperonin GroEL (HSP60 family)